MRKGILLATVAGFAAMVGTGAVNAADKLKIGVTATLEGTYTVLGEDGMRGYDLGVEAHGGKAGGKEIETIVGSTDASPDSAVRAAKKLVEQDKVDVLISPLSGSEGIAIRDYSKTQPQITVMNAASGALETTYGDPSAGITPSPTFYRTNMDGAQWHAGLGDYAYNVKGYKKTFIPLASTMLVLFLAAMIFLGTFFGFQNGSNQHSFPVEQGQGKGSHTYIAW